MKDADRRKKILEKMEDLKMQINELGTEIERERNENSEEDSAIRQELLDKREILEQQISELQNSLAIASSAELMPEEVGKTFTIEINGISRNLIVVLPDEADPSAGKISIDSPIAKALSGRKKGESVEVVTPAGTQIFIIAKIA